ncbi:MULTISPECIES: trypco2 family protein [unclassified Streptomyces]|uniref:trypco2 family protein n=1 Tax=unclassified Streptomyces TaxID=2593676 RepID=UPI002E125836|nr:MULTISPECIES: trypco2 family protein [unclassified Streptomyces]WSR24292.1 hypothetical protein OG573_37930 [Streptomyces sp. NBC_01205]
MKIGLADAVAAVREEIAEAVDRGAGQDVTFTLGPVELEFEVVLQADAKAKTGFRAWVVSVDAEAGISRGRTHRVAFTLTPQRANGYDVLVSGAPERAPGPGDTSGRIED